MTTEERWSSYHPSNSEKTFFLYENWPSSYSQYLFHRVLYTSLLSTMHVISHGDYTKGPINARFVVMARATNGLLHGNSLINKDIASGYIIGMLIV